MVSTVNTGARLDRLPISSFHYRIFWLIGAGMFFDGYDLYVGASVLGASVLSIVAGAIYPYMVNPVPLLLVGFVLIVGI